MSAPTAPTDLAPAVPGDDELAPLFARAYHDAALAHRPMRPLVDLLEPVRADVPSDGYALWTQLDGLVARAEADLTPVLVAVRDGVVVRIVEGIRAQLLDRLHDGAGVDTWLAAFVAAFDRERWRVCEALLRPDGLPDATRPWRDRLAGALADARLSRWFGLRPLLLDLLPELDSHPDARCRAHALLVELELFIYADVPAAAGWLERGTAAGPPDHLRLAEVTAELDIESGAFGPAITRIREWLGGHQDDGSLAIQLAECLRATGAADEADALLLATSRATPTVPVHRALMRAYGDAGRHPRRERRLAQLAERARLVDPDARYPIDLELGRAYLARGNTAAARTTLRRCTEQRPERVEAWADLIRVEAAAPAADPHESLRIARDAAARAGQANPQDTSAAQALADLLEQRSDWPEAIAVLEAAVAVTPGRRWYLLARLASAHQQADDVPACAQALAAAAQDAPGEPRLLDYLAGPAGYLWSAGRGAEVAAAVGDVAAHRANGEAVVAGWLGDIAFDAHDWPAAAAQFERAATADPRNPAFLRSLARVRREQHDWAAALECSTRAHTLDADDAAFADDRGLLANDRANEAFEAGRYADAVALYREAIGHMPSPVILANLATGLDRAMEKGTREASLSEALDALQRAAELDPSADYGVRAELVGTRLDRVRRFGELVLGTPDIPAIAIEFADDLVPKVDATQRGQDVIPVLIPEMRRDLRAVLGFDVPGVRMRGSYLPPTMYSILIHNVEQARGTAHVDRDCLLAAADVLVAHGLDRADILEAHDPVTGNQCTWAAPDDLDRIELPDVVRLTDVGFVLRHVADVVRRRAVEFFGLDDARQWLAETGAGLSGPQLIAGARGLRALVRDGVRLVPEMTGVLRTALDPSAPPGPAAVAAAVAAVRAGFPRELAGGGSERWTLPESTAAMLRATGSLPAVDEHNLLRQLAVEAEAGSGFTVVAPDERSRTYLQRLIDLDPQFGGAVRPGVVTATEGSP